MVHASSQLASVPVDLSGAGNASLTAADVDGNGSNDLVLLNPTTATLLRSTHGDPPLLALAALTPASVVGGALTQGTVTLGGPAPAAGATVALSSSNPSLAYPLVPAVTIPAGASTATFQVSTAAVAQASSVSISATYNLVTQTANVALVAPYALSGLTVSPANQFGGFSAQGTVVLSGPADSSANVGLSSSNGALLSLPASVTVPRRNQRQLSDHPATGSDRHAGLAFGLSRWGDADSGRHHPSPSGFRADHQG